MSTSELTVCAKCGSVYVSVPGEPVSKSNSRQLIPRGGRMIPIKSKKALELERHWKQHCPEIDPLITDDVEVWFRLTYKTRRPDLDESLIMDLLQDKIIKNDRQIKVKHVYHALDQSDPRSEVIVNHIGNDMCDFCSSRIRSSAS